MHENASACRQEVQQEPCGGEPCGGGTSGQGQEQEHEQEPDQESDDDDLDGSETILDSDDDTDGSTTVSDSADDAETKRQAKHTVAVHKKKCAALRRQAKQHVKEARKLERTAVLAERQNERKLRSDELMTAKQLKQEERKQARAAATAKQLEVVAALEARKVVRGDTDEYRDYVREVVNTCVRREATVTQTCGLVTMTKQALSTHVTRCCGKKSMYQGAQGGRPAHLAEDAQLMHIMDAARRKSERTCLKLPDEMKQVLQLAQASLKARGRRPLPKSFAYDQTSKTIQ